MCLCLCLWLLGRSWRSILLLWSGIIGESRMALESGRRKPCSRGTSRRGLLWGRLCDGRGHRRLRVCSLLSRTLLLGGVGRVPSGVDTRVSRGRVVRIHAREVLLQDAHLQGRLVSLVYRLLRRRTESGLSRARHLVHALVHGGRTMRLVLWVLSRCPWSRGRWCSAVLRQSLRSSRVLDLLRLKAGQSRRARNTRSSISSLDATARDHSRFNDRGLGRGWRTSAGACGRGGGSGSKPVHVALARHIEMLRALRLRLRRRPWSVALSRRC